MVATSISCCLLHFVLYTVHFSHSNNIFQMVNKNKGGGKKRGKIHKRRNKIKQVSPRKSRKALLNQLAEKSNTCPAAAIGNQALPEVSGSSRTMEKELQLNIDASTTMPSNQSQFQKFKDNLLKKKFTRLTRKSNKSYSVKLSNSIKRRVFHSQGRNSSAIPKIPKRYFQLQITKQKLHQPPKQRKLSPKQSQPKPKFYSKTEDGEIIEEIESSDEDDCIVMEPVMTKIIIDTDEEEDDHKIESKESIVVNVEDNSPTDNVFQIDTKRGNQLWNRFVNGTNSTNVEYVTNNVNPLSKENKLCITIDDSCSASSSKVDQQQSAAKNLLDDSVIFVEDFIPLSSGKDDDDNSISPKRKRRTKSVEDESRAAKTPKMVTQRMNESLFTSTERKKLADYNSNTYNPGVESNAPVTHKRSIIIDGSNVAFGHGRSNIFSSEGIKYCVEYFEKMGHDVKAVIPLFRRNAHKSSNPALLDQLYKEGKIVFTPCKNLPNQQAISYDDRFILQLAYERNAAVVSNDNYRDLIHENAAFKKIIENRVIGYSWCDNILILPKDPYGRFGPPLAEILRC